MLPPPRSKITQDSLPRSSEDETPFSVSSASSCPEIIFTLWPRCSAIEVIKVSLLAAFLTTPVAITRGEDMPNLLAMAKNSRSAVMVLAMAPGLSMQPSLLLKPSPSLVITLFRKTGVKAVPEVPFSAINILMELVPISMDAMGSINCQLWNQPIKRDNTDFKVPILPA